MDSSLKNRMAEFLDPVQVEELQSIPGEGNSDLFTDVAGLFLHTTPELMENLGKAIEAGDKVTAAKHAHMLKGSSSNLGAFGLSERSHQLEQSALKGGADLQVLFREISAYYENLRAILKEILETPPS